MGHKYLGPYIQCLVTIFSSAVYARGGGERGGEMGHIEVKGLMQAQESNPDHVGWQLRALPTKLSNSHIHQVPWDFLICGSSRYKQFSIFSVKLTFIKKDWQEMMNKMIIPVFLGHPVYIGETYFIYF